MRFETYERLSRKGELAERWPAHVPVYCSFGPYTGDDTMAPSKPDPEIMLPEGVGAAIHALTDACVAAHGLPNERHRGVRACRRSARDRLYLALREGTISLEALALARSAGRDRGGAPLRALVYAAIRAPR